MRKRVECPSCGEPVHRLFAPPRVRVLRRQLGLTPEPACEGQRVWWRLLGQGWPRPESFNVIAVEEGHLIIRPWDAPDSPICMGCWVGCIWPALYPYLDNKPGYLRLNAWRDPTWRARWQLRSAKPRPRRISRNHYWPHLNGHLGLTMPRQDIGVPLIIIDDWPIIRKRILARVRELNPDHPWVKETTHLQEEEGL